MSIHPVDFFTELSRHNIDFFTGVPDSLLKELSLCIDDHSSETQHVITANEGNAIALAAGYNLASNKIPLVYMQNSGLGNAVNPLLSLCDPEVYSIPMLILIGWRGEPGIKDEPQHIKQGKVQIKLLETLSLPYKVISNDEKQYKMKIADAVEIAKEKNRPVVILIKKGTFSRYSERIIKYDNKKMKREEALEIILNNLKKDVIIVSTTGKTSREIFEIREKRNQSHQQEFLTVGSMGHCSSIALGISLAKINREVVCIDGDGSMLMHLGSLTTIASLKPKNFRHILLNNEVHESVGGQSTAAKDINLSSLVKTIGSSNMFIADSLQKLEKYMMEFMAGVGPSFLEVKIQPGARSDLGRPTIKPIDNKNSFMKFIVD